MTATYVAAAAGETLLVEVETATPGTYAAPLTINLARSLELSATAEKSVIPRTDNPSAPGKTVAVITSVDWKASGAGTVNLGDDVTYATWLLSGAPKNVRISNANTGGMVLIGAAVLTTFSMNSDGIGKKVQGSIALEGADIPAVTTHA